MHRVHALSRRGPRMWSVAEVARSGKLRLACGAQGAAHVLHEGPVGQHAVRARREGVHILQPQVLAADVDKHKLCVARQDALVHRHDSGAAQEAGLAEVGDDSADAGALAVLPRQTLRCALEDVGQAAEVVRVVHGRRVVRSLLVLCHRAERPVFGGLQACGELGDDVVDVARGTVDGDVLAQRVDDAVIHLVHKHRQVDRRCRRQLDVAEHVRCTLVSPAQAADEAGQADARAVVQTLPGPRIDGRERREDDGRNNVVAGVHGGEHGVLAVGGDGGFLPAQNLDDRVFGDAVAQEGFVPTETLDGVKGRTVADVHEDLVGLCKRAVVVKAPPRLAHLHVRARHRSSLLSLLCRDRHVHRCPTHRGTLAKACVCSQ
eukprot:Rhum_TRINITY_DN3499_c0_g1::Rhum_TRINITY_DN3499_c0_g1_i1::g.10989::m.10989